jgi:quinol monooxygenase YgiN
MERFGLHGKLRAQPGKRDQLLEHLLEAAKLMEAVDGCDLYAVSTSPSDDDAVHVTEIWLTEADHDASLSLPGVPELIRRARPLIAGGGESTRLVVRGGKGLSPAR